MRFTDKLLVAGLAAISLIVMLWLPNFSFGEQPARPTFHPVSWRIVSQRAMQRTAQRRRARVVRQLHELWENVRTRFPSPKSGRLVVVDIRTQTLFLLKHGLIAHRWPVSTSIDGTDQIARSDGTPLGVFRVARKLGTGLPPGAILHDQVPTGRVVAPVRAPDDQAASRWITTRIMWLSGLQPGWNEGGDVDSYLRHIYIHGTANLGMLGRPGSHGCVQMAPHAVIALYRAVPVGTLVAIIPGTGSLAAIPGTGSVG